MAGSEDKDKSEELNSPADDESRQELLDEHLSDTAKCAECDKPVDNLRKTCPHCGHEYDPDEQDDKEAGNELKAGLALNEDGSEITDESVLED